MTRSPLLHNYHERNTIDNRTLGLFHENNKLDGFFFILETPPPPDLQSQIPRFSWYGKCFYHFQVFQ